MNRIPIIASFLAATLLGSLSAVAAARSTTGGTQQELLIATPPYFADYERLRGELRDRGIPYGEKVSLGTPRLVVSSTVFRHAKAVAIDYTKRRSLTVRLAQDMTSGKWEIWEHGSKQGKENYRVPRAKSQ